MTRGKPFSDIEIGAKSRRRKRRSVRQFLFCTIALLLLTAVGHFIWGWRAESRLNALVEQYRQAGEPVTPEDFATPTLPDPQNAATYLRQAAALIQTDSAVWKAYEKADENYNGLPLEPGVLAAYENLTVRYRVVFTIVDRAAAWPAANWGIRFASPIMYTDFPDCMSQRTLVRLLSVAAMYAHQNRDDAGAVRLIRQILHISRSVDQIPMEIPHLIALGFSSVGSDLAVKIAPDLLIADEPHRHGAMDELPRVGHPARPQPASRVEIKALIQDLLDTNSLRDCGRKAVLAERMMMVDLSRSIVAGEVFLKDAPSPTDAHKNSASVVGYSLKPMALSDASLTSEYATKVYNALDAPDFPSFKAKMSGASFDYSESSKLMHPVAAFFHEWLSRPPLLEYKMTAERRMSAVVLACQLYKLDQQRLPRVLADLVPMYLTEVPIDPMSAGHPLGYLGQGSRPMVYSVGEDGRDDGGYEPPPETSRAEWLKKSDEIRDLLRRPPLKITITAGEEQTLEPAGPKLDGSD